MVCTRASSRSSLPVAHRAAVRPGTSVPIPGDEEEFNVAD
eukprot:COSAG04_NODE_32171_length_252_cov_1.019608_1_plen_39_part_10